MTIPNLITTLRIVLTPIFIIYLINDEMLAALIVFLICGISDGVDGMVARFFNQKSTLGAYLDPLADKLLLVSAFIALAVKQILPAWLTVVVITRDVMILLGIFILFFNQLDLKIKPSFISKVNTCLQFFLLIILLAKKFLPLPPLFYDSVFYLTAFFTVSSGLHYMYYWFKILGDGSGSDDRKT